MTERELEAKVKELGLTAPRITPELVDAEITDAQYWRVPDTTVTVCALTLKNGFVLIGKSGAASYENFNEGIGKSVAYDNARDQVWQLLGFRLKDALVKSIKEA